MSGEGTGERTDAYRALVESATDALFVVDGTGRFDIVNGEFLDLVGYDRDDLLGTDVRALLHDDDVSAWEQRVNLLEHGEMTETDTWSARVRTSHATVIAVDFRLSVLDADGGAGLVGIARDTRERQRREQRLNVLNRALRHNIRNRMNVILGRAEMLQEIDDEGYRTAAEQIERVGQEMINVSNKARKAHKHPDVPADEDCRIDLVAPTEQVLRKFAISYPDADTTANLPDEARALAPPSYEVALMELLENAVVHHPSGNGPVTVDIETDDDRVGVHVTDECEPIPDSVVETLDQGTEQPLHHNEGIGLWIVEWVAETVGGDLGFDRRADGDGNVVTLRFDAIET